MTPILKKRHLKKGGIYAVYSNSTRRKELTFFRLTRKTLYDVHGRQFITNWTNVTEHAIDWGVYEYTFYSGQIAHNRPYELDLYRSWKLNEFFEVTEDEILTHVMMETI
jgi:hypothetical protein